MKISWGMKELDDLTGGIRDILTCIFGETGSGKTTLSSYIPILQIWKHLEDRIGEIPENGRFIVIDGDGGFDLDRASQIFENNNVDMAKVKKRIEYYQPISFKEQHNLVKNLYKKIEKKGWKPLFITFDPITAIYRGIILRTDLSYRATTIGTYTGKLDLQINNLRHISVENEIPVFITTWPSSPVGDALGERKAETDFIGGRQIGFLPKIIFRLSIPKRGQPLRRATLWKARDRPEGKFVEFKLTDKGIEKI